MNVSGASFPTPAHYEMLIRAKRSLSDVAPLISKAEACGVDCQEFREGHAYLSGTIDRFLNQYFPDQLQPPTGTGIPTRGD